MALSKKDQAALDELNAYLASRNEKTNKQNDKRIIANSNMIAQRADNPSWKEKLSESNRKTWSDPEVKAKHREAILKSQTPDYLEKHRIGQKEKWNNPKNREAHLIAVRKNAQDPTWQENVRKANVKKLKDPTWQENHKKGIERRSESDWYEKNAKKNTLLKSKPIVTPYGIYSSRINAVNALKHIPNIGGKINAGVKKEDSGYFYITKEEYIRLTGENPWA